MLKKHVLHILSSADIAKVIGKHRSQVTRFTKEIPEQYRSVVLAECKKRAKKINRALEQICRKGEK